MLCSKAALWSGRLQGTRLPSRFLLEASPLFLLIVWLAVASCRHAVEKLA